MGHFQIRGFIDRPATLTDANNEGITFAPESECVGGTKSFFWADDGNTGSHALRRGTVELRPAVLAARPRARLLAPDRDVRAQRRERRERR